MTPYSRVTKERPWEAHFPERPWRYQTPLDILIKASNGASDFEINLANRLLAGSVFTFEYTDENQRLGFDKVIMLAGGVGFGHQQQAQKSTLKRGQNCNPRR